MAVKTISTKTSIKDQMMFHVINALGIEDYEKIEIEFKTMNYGCGIVSVRNVHYDYWFTPNKICSDGGLEFNMLEAY